MYHSSLSVFMTSKTPSGARKHCKGTKPTTRKMGQTFLFLLLSSSFFRRASWILCEPLTLVYTQNSSILYGAVHNPIAFSQLQSLTISVKNYGFLFGMPFCTHVELFWSIFQSSNPIGQYIIHNCMHMQLFIEWQYYLAITIIIAKRK